MSISSTPSAHSRLTRRRESQAGKLGLPLLAIILVLFLSGQLTAQCPDSGTLIKAERLLDPKTGNVLSPVAVLVENGKVKEVGAPSQVQSHAPTSVKTIELGRATLLPGVDRQPYTFVDGYSLDSGSRAGASP
jgi:hypothetical protein